MQGARLARLPCVRITFGSTLADGSGAPQVCLNFNAVHLACIAGTAFADTCSQCQQKTLGACTCYSLSGAMPCLMNAKRLQPLALRLFASGDDMTTCVAAVPWTASSVAARDSGGYEVIDLEKPYESKHEAPGGAGGAAGAAAQRKREAVAAAAPDPASKCSRLGTGPVNAMTEDEFLAFLLSGNRPGACKADNHRNSGRAGWRYCPHRHTHAHTRTHTRVYGQDAYSDEPVRVKLGSTMSLRASRRVRARVKQ